MQYDPQVNSIHLKDTQSGETKEVACEVAFATDGSGSSPDRVPSWRHPQTTRWANPACWQIPAAEH